MDISNRVYVVRSYPIRTSSGLTPLIYGHESGITLIWSNGHSLDPTSEPRVDVSLGSAVLDIAVPQIPSTPRLRLSTLPPILSNSIVIAVACSNCDIRVLTLPLEPTSQSFKSSEVVSAAIPHQSIPSSLSLTWTSASKEYDENDEDTFIADDDEDLDLDLTNVDWLVASCSSDGNPKLSITSFTLNQEKQQRAHSSIKALLTALPLKVAFNPSIYPSKQHSKVLVTCSNGYVYIYDPLSTDDSARRVQSQSYGRWIASFSTKYVQPNKDDRSSIPRKKRILDAQWALNGKFILALLADGEWGIWDVSGHQNSSTSQASNSFALWGMIGSGIPSHVNSKPVQKSLPTMTPNTRKFKEESLFVGQNVPASAVSRGGITVKPVPLPSADNNEDFVALWFNDTICYIDSLQSYWNRALKRSGDSKLRTSGGSLFGPGLTRIEGIDLHGQSITSIALVLSQIEDTSIFSKSILLSTEHQLILSQSGSKQFTSRPSNKFRSQARPQTQNDLSQSLLKTGDLDINGLESMLDSMHDRPDAKMLDSTTSPTFDNEFMSGEF